MSGFAVHGTDDRVSESHFSQLKGAPVKVCIQIVCDENFLGRGGGCGFVFKIDGVGQLLVCGNVVLCANTGCGGFFVGVNRYNNTTFSISY